MINYTKILNDAAKYVMETAHHSPLNWFFELHQREVIASAKELLKEYPEADQNIVLLSAWLHDLGHFKAKTLEEVDLVKPDHHITGSKMAETFLAQYNLPQNEIEKIKNCVLRHRAKEPYLPKTIEENIVTVADTMSHFKSIFYLIYFKIYPDETLDEYVEKQKEKLARDWRDLSLLPKAQDIYRSRYENLMSMLDSYKM